MKDIFVMLLSGIGSIFILTAAIGVLRMPDFYLRLSVTVKAATLGIGFLLGAVAVHFMDFSVTTKVVAITFFLILTAPVAGHMIGRTAYFTGIKLWDHSVADDLKGKYDKKTHELKSEGKLDEIKTEDIPDDPDAKKPMD